MSEGDERGLGDLLAALEAEAVEEIARLDGEARREAEAIRAVALEEAARLERAPAEAQEAALAAEVERRLGAARLEAARIHREAREAAFREALDELRRRLAGIRAEPCYRELLRGLLLEAREALPAARVARVDPRDEALAAELVAGLGPAVSPALETWGGVVLETDDGRVLVNTLEERLANAEPELRLLLARRAVGVTAAGGPR